MKKMQFKVACVKEFLEKNGFVFTVRAYDYGDVSYADSEVGLVLRKRIKELEENRLIDELEDLEEYTIFSGFWEDNYEYDTALWWTIIEGFCKGKRKWLYLVVRIPLKDGTKLLGGFEFWNNKKDERFDKL